MSVDTFRAALGSRLGEVLTPETAAWLEAHAFDRFLPAPNVAPMGERVMRLENEMLKVAQVDCPVREYFSPGMYAREITIPKGTVLIGAVHKTQNMAVLSAGRLRMVTDTGTKEICAPMVVQVMPGQKNVAVALEDSVWTNFFPTTETDPRKLVELLTESTYDELLGGIKNPQLLMQAELNKLEV